MSDELGKVVLFPKVKDDAPAIEPPAHEQRKYRLDECRHNVQLVLDEEAHQLKCPECGQVLDPFDWIVDYVRKWARENSLYRQARQQAIEAQKRVKELERVEKNAKARLRKRGVVLSTADARTLRTQFYALERAVFERAGGDRAAGLKLVDGSGVDRAELLRVLGLLNDAIGLRDRSDAA